MKNTIRVLALLLTLALVSTVFVACGSLSGTYRTEDLLGSYSELVFKGSKVTMNTYAVGVLATSVEYTYKLKDNTLVLTDKDGNDSSLAFSKDGDAIKVGVLTYKKK